MWQKVLLVVVVGWLDCPLSVVYGHGPHHPRTSHRHVRASHGTTEKLTQDRQLLQDKEYVDSHLPNKNAIFLI